MNDTFTCIYCVQLVIRELWFFDFIVDNIIKEPQLPYMYMYMCTYMYIAANCK